MTIARAAELSAAYATCRAIAKRAAKNFYYGFVALPRHKSDAMCAVYAFMRRADDIADDENRSVADRRAQLASWLHAFRDGTGVSPQDQPVFLAVRDVQQRFGITDTLLEELVAGIAMDLAEEVPAGVARVPFGGRLLDVYTTVEALERYCYLVASVVGLVTVRIFGYQDPETEALAVRMGYAFQLTNILRDVREDAERSRIYLPLDVLQGQGATVDDVMRASRDGAPNAALIAAMRQLAQHAEVYYGVAPDLVAKLDADTRGAMRTLVTIYRTLLHRIDHVEYQVFSQRISVPAHRKLGILARGMLTRSLA